MSSVNEFEVRPAISNEFFSVASDPDVAVFTIQIAAMQPRVSNARLDQAVAEGRIAVLYPEISEPYRSVFTQIIEGIKAQSKGPVADFALKQNENVSGLREALKSQNTKVVIALGRRGMQVASALDGGMDIVVGGVLSVSGEDARELQVNSLTPDPALLFARLKGMMPKVRRIFTVYDPRQNEWLIRLAKEGAKAQGVELVAYQAQDLRAAMLVYQEILSIADGSSDALWLPQDSTTVEDSSVMPLVLQESWGRNLAVFSSSFAHVKRGVLFSLYPDNVELGRRLAGSAQTILASGEGGSGLHPLREVLMAVNLRTAKHLGIGGNRLPRVDMAFPEP